MINPEDNDLLTLISQELSDADQNLDYETPLDYYLGNQPVPSAEDEDEEDSASDMVSTDVADAIEWIMPQVMKSFTQNNEVVIFDPTGPEDERQAELESEYTYDVLMKENDGFITLHQMVKDALLQNNGHIKVYYQNRVFYDLTDFTGLTQEQVMGAAMDQSVEIVSRSERIVTGPEGQPVPVYDIRISIGTNTGRVVVESVAPEDLRVNTNHNSVNLDDARFVAHLMTKTVSDLRQEGVEDEIIDKLTSDDYDYDSAYRFAAQGETYTTPETESNADESIRVVNLAECYLHSDIDGDGIAEYVKVTVGGQSCPTTIIDIEEISESPWVNTTAILMSHKWRGLSIYDRLKEIQNQKTALLRNTLENIYLQNNQRHIVVEGKATKDTVNDLMLSRPGGVIRAKAADAVLPLATPQFNTAGLDIMSYLDAIRAGRVGVAPEGEVKPQRLGERVGSEGVARLMSAKEELIGLIVRVIAETGVKPLCVKIRDLCTRHIDAIQPYKFRGEWIKINPAKWPGRVRTTVRVGTGTGNHDRQIGAIAQILQIQEKIGAMPGQVLINHGTVYKALDDFCKFSGLNSALGYFVDPNSPQGKKASQVAQQKQKKREGEQQAMLMSQLDMQKKLASAETEKANAARLNVEYKSQAEQAKSALDAANQQIEKLKTIANTSLESQKLDIDRADTMISAGLKLTEIEAKSVTEQNKNYQANLKSVETSAPTTNTSAK